MLPPRAVKYVTGQTASSTPRQLKGAEKPPSEIFSDCMECHHFNAAPFGPQNGGTQMSKYPAKIEKITRRDFLNTAGAVAAGGLVVVAGSSLLGGNQANAAVQQAAPPLPWKYTKLDPMEAGKRGYKNYLAKGG